MWLFAYLEREDCSTDVVGGLWMGGVAIMVGLMGITYRNCIGRINKMI